jgi:hypothetical protein
MKNPCAGAMLMTLPLALVEQCAASLEGVLRGEIAPRAA